jgi:hypothetical protein
MKHRKVKAWVVEILFGLCTYGCHIVGAVLKADPQYYVGLYIIFGAFTSFNAVFIGGVFADTWVKSKYFRPELHGGTESDNG